MKEQVDLSFSLFKFPSGSVCLKRKKKGDVFCAGAMARRVCLSLTEELSGLNCSTF